MSDLGYSSIFKAIQKKYPDIDFVGYYESGVSAHSRFLIQMQDRFQDVSKDDGISLLILTPEELRFMFNIASVAKTSKIIHDDGLMGNIILEEYFRNKTKKIGLDFDKITSMHEFRTLNNLHSDTQDMMYNAYSASFPYEVQTDNKRITVPKALSIIVMPHYSTLDMQFVNNIPNATKKLKEKNIPLNDVYISALFHELGHALEKDNALSGFHHGSTSDTILNNISRYRTECIADVFSVLQMARLRGNTDLAEVEIMVRAKYLRDSYKSFKHVNNQMQKTIYDDLVATYGENGFSQDNIDNAMQTSHQLQMHELGEHMNYFTILSIDCAKDVANDLLKDGVLNQLTDKEILDLTVKITDNTTFEKNHLIAMFYGIVQGETDNELFDTFNKYTSKALDYFGIKDKETARDKKYKKELHERQCRQLGFDNGTNGLTAEIEVIKKNRRYERTITKLDKEAIYQYKRHSEKFFSNISKTTPDDLSIETKHMLYMLESMKFGQEKIKQYHKKNENNYNRRSNDFQKDQAVCAIIHENFIEGADGCAIKAMQKNEFKKEFLIPYTKDYKGSLYELIAKFTTLQANNIVFMENNYSNKVKPRFILSPNDRVKYNKIDKDNIEYMAVTENKLLKIAEQIREHSEFDELRANNSQLHKHISFFKGRNGLMYTEMLYNRFYFGSLLPDVLIKEKNIYREMFKQRNCGLAIAAKLPPKAREEFLSSIKTFNGHNLAKKIQQGLIANKKQVKQKS